VLISLHSFLDSTHTNYLTTTRKIFNFLYKEIMDTIIFVIHMLRLSNILCRCFFHSIIKIFKNIIIHIKLKNSSYHIEL
jgi:hypothetical protein